MFGDVSPVVMYVCMSSDNIGGNAPALRKKAAYLHLADKGSRAFASHTRDAGSPGILSTFRVV